MGSDDLLADGVVDVKGVTREYSWSGAFTYKKMLDGTLPFTHAGRKRPIPRRAIKKLLAAGFVNATPATK